MKGYFYRMLDVDLSDGSVQTMDFDENYARKYLGGNGFAAEIIRGRVPRECDPRGEMNTVVFALGPLNNTPVWATGRGHCAGISPLTGMFVDSNFGGNAAYMMKRTGFDAVIIHGRAEKPVYLSINEENAVLKDASSLWGLTTGESHARIATAEGKGAETALIGPAGENGVSYASIICSGRRVSAAGRGGLGAVLGGKNLKGISFLGTRNTEIAHRDRLMEHLKTNLPKLRESAKALTETGTPVLVDMINRMGKLCTRNNVTEVWDRAGSINGAAIAEHKVRNIACHGCPVACGKLVSVTDGPWAGEAVKMPEFETLYALGSMLENDSLVQIFNANAACDEMGLDTISFGVTLAFLIECFNEGMIQIDQINELLPRLKFGAQENLYDIVLQTANNESPLGELLAKGSRALAGEFGGDAYKFLYETRGLEIAGHSARGILSMGLAYATSTRGGSHHDARPQYPDPDYDVGFEPQPAYCVDSQHNTAVGDSLVICRFIQERALGRFINEDYLPYLNFVTGVDWSVEELSLAGERIYNLERLINVNQGCDRSHDRLPYRVTSVPIPDGPVAGRYCPEPEFQKMLDEYYRLRGWDGNGIPTDVKLQELGINRVLGHSG